MRVEDGSAKIRVIAKLSEIGEWLGTDEGMDSFRSDYRGAVRLNQGGENICSGRPDTLFAKLLFAKLVPALTTWLGKFTLLSIWQVGMPILARWIDGTT